MHATRTMAALALLASSALALGGCAEDAGDGEVMDAGGERMTADAGRTLGDLGVVPDTGEAPETDAAPEADAGEVVGDGGPEVDAAPMVAQCSDGEDNDGDGHIDDADRGCSGPEDDNEGDEVALPECENAEDDDGDGRYDLADPDCTSPADPREQGEDPVSACSNGVDDDDDGAIDFPDDRGCGAAGDDDETDQAFIGECADEVDNDEDGAVDYPQDPGCQGRGDGSEADPPVAPGCSNGEDDDGDGATDYPVDTGCDSAGDFSEVGPCGAGVDVIDLNAEVAGDGHYEGTLMGAPENTVGTCGGAAGGERVFRYVVSDPLERLVFSTANEQTPLPTVLYARRSCGLPADLQCNRGFEAQPGTTLVLERPGPGTYYLFVDTGSRELGAGPFRLTVEPERTPECRDLLDNDGDDLIDNADPGCAEGDDVSENDPDEPPACANGIDDDGDGDIDHPDDTDCEFAGGLREQPVCPGGPELIRVGQEGGQFELPIPMGNGGSNPSCEPGLGAEVVFVLDLDLPSDVTINVTQGANPAQIAVYVREDCQDVESEVACKQAQRAEPLFIEELGRGTWYVLVELGFVAPPEPRMAIIQVESVITQCNDLVDNDGDGLIDLFDPGCERGRDMTEADPAEPPQCADGIDNDEDGLIDYPADEIGCDAAGDDDEQDWRAPDVGLRGRVGVFDGADWQVCRADEETAWVSTHAGGGSYNAVEICAHLGYEGGVDEWGGTCGTLCGYCNNIGNENYDGGGGQPERLGRTVHWRCVRGDR